MSEKQDTLILSIRLESGGLETTLRVPFPCTYERGKVAMEQWLELVMTAFRQGADNLTASYPVDPDFKEVGE